MKRQPHWYLDSEEEPKLFFPRACWRIWDAGGERPSVLVAIDPPAWDELILVLEAADGRNLFETQRMPFTVGIYQVRDYSILTGTPLEPKHLWFWNKGTVWASPLDPPITRGFGDSDWISRYTFPDKVATWVGLGDDS